MRYRACINGFGYKKAAPTGKKMRPKQTNRTANREPPGLLLFYHYRARKVKYFSMTDREQLKEEICSGIRCTDYLQKSKNGLYCCPLCHSGKGNNGTGAVKYYPETNTWYCHSCENEKLRGRWGDALDLIMYDRGVGYNEALKIGAAAIGREYEHETNARPTHPERTAGSIPLSAIKREQEQIENEAIVLQYGLNRAYTLYCKKGTLSEAATVWLEENAGYERGDNLQELFAYYKCQEIDLTEEAAAIIARVQQGGAWKTDAAAIDNADYYIECIENLANSEEAKSYLMARGISYKTAEAFNIGYDAEADPAGSGHKAPRIIIPTSESHYIGRRIDGVKDFAKMNNKGGSPGIFNADAIYRNKTVWITEGAFDAMSLAECGAAAIALNSTSNTELLPNMLKNRPTETAFVICFDNDPNPETAAKTTGRARGLQEALKALNVRSIIFDIKEYAQEGEKDLNDILRRDRGAIEQMISAAEKELHRDVLTDFLDKVQTEAYKPYRTGLNFFDDLLGGGVIQQSLLLLLAAPGTGKTTLAQQIAEAMAAHQKPVMYLNLEMSREQMLAKALSGRITRKGTPKTALEILQGYNWTAADRKAITDEIGSYRQQILPYMQYNPGDIGNNLGDILTYLHNEGERAKATGRQAPAIILDYLHLLSSSKGLDVQELIKQAIVGLKQYALEYNTFVIAIAAIGRGSNGRINLASARDSSNIEYTGDYMLSLDYYDIDNGNTEFSDAAKVAELQQEKYRRMILRVLKGRLVPPGKSANVYFNAANNLFYGEGEFIPADPERVPFDKREKPIQRR